MLVRQDHRLRTIACAELGEDMVDMGLDRCLAHIQFRCDLAIRASLHDQMQDLAFAFGQTQLLGY